MKLPLLAFSLIALMGTACSGEKKEDNIEKEGVETVLPTMPNDVTVQKLEKQVFNHELVSNGKVRAQEYADVYFQTTEAIATIYVKNGDMVAKGQKLAELDKFKLNHSVKQAKDRLEQAQLELKDVLIGQGYSPDNLSSVPKDIMELAKVKSGYEQSQSQYDMAVKELEQATLTAPFSGLVANLFQKVHNRASASEAFCRIINNRDMEVSFTVLESELPLIKNGDKVIITPYSSTVNGQEGSICEINPLVDENSMVQVKARLNGGSKLFDGMNVRVNVHPGIGRKADCPEECGGFALRQTSGIYLKRGESHVELCANRIGEYGIVYDRRRTERGRHGHYFGKPESGSRNSGKRH